MSNDIIPCGGGWSAEIRSMNSWNGTKVYRIALSHADGGLHMADEAETAMVREIERLRKRLATIFDLADEARK